MNNFDIFFVSYTAYDFFNLKPTISSVDESNENCEFILSSPYDPNRQCFYKGNLCYLFHVPDVFYTEEKCNRNDPFQYRVSPILAEDKHFVISLRAKHRIHYHPQESYSTLTGFRRLKTSDAYLNRLYRYVWWDPTFRIILYDPSLRQLEKDFPTIHYESVALKITF